MKLKLKFENCDRALTLRDLNNAYGHIARTYPTLAKAKEAQANDGGRITKLVNHRWTDVKDGAVVDGAKPYTMGWLLG